MVQSVFSNKSKAYLVIILNCGHCCWVSLEIDTWKHAHSRDASSSEKLSSLRRYFVLILILVYFSFFREQPIFTCKAHVFHIDPKTKRSWLPASSAAVNVSFFYDSSRGKQSIFDNLIKIIRSFNLQTENVKRSKLHNMRAKSFQAKRTRFLKKWLNNEMITLPIEIS